MSSGLKKYSQDEVLQATLEYFNGDELATSAWMGKYCITDGSDLYEKTPEDMHKRLAEGFAQKEEQYNSKKIKEEDFKKLSDYGQKREKLTNEKIFNYFDKFKYIVPQGSVMSLLGNPFKTGSLSNCIVLPEIHDSYGGIFYADQQLAQLAKRRCGIGLDISTLRPNSSPVSNAAGSSTGAVSFMERFSNTTREVAQNGRRGALMLSIDVAHPDAGDFVKIKQDLSKVTGANISIKLSDEFMTAVEKDTEYTHRWPIDVPIHKAKITKIIKAKDLWDEIIKAAHMSAEPGLMFWDRHHWYSPSSVYPFAKNITVNPCTAAGTLVDTPNGQVKVEDIKVGDIISTLHGSEPVESIEAHSNYPTYKVEFSNGYIHYATAAHQYYVLPRSFREEDYTGDFTEFSYGAPYGGYTQRLDECNARTCILFKDGNKTSFLRIKEVEFSSHCNVYDLYCSGSDSWITSGVCQRGCGEVPMGNDSCRLIANNMYGCVDGAFSSNAQFSTQKWYEVCYESQRLADDLVDLELDAVRKILNKVSSDPEPDYIKSVEHKTWFDLFNSGKKYRRTGTGYTGQADTMAALGVGYGSTQAKEILELIMRVKCQAEFDSSVDMAIERGAFDGFDPEIENTSEFTLMLKKEFPELYERMMKYGRRNISISTVAPTGTLSIMTQTSSGIEPVFMLQYKRRKKVNAADINTRVDYTDHMGDIWQEFTVNHPKLQAWINTTGESDITKSPYFGSTAEEINWQDRVELQAIVQKYTTHSISSTINLPENVSKETVGEIYMQAWKAGLKGITVYRAGSRSGVLISDKETQKKANDLIENHAPKRPKELPAIVYTFMNKSEKWIGLLGLLNGKPYEIFTGPAEQLNLGNQVEYGTIRKVKIDGKSRYDLVYLDGHGNEKVIEGLSQAFNPEYYNYAKMISMQLRHGTPIEYVVELVSNIKLDQEVLNTWKAGVARMLKKYVKDGTKAADAKCDNCGDPTGLVYQEGCVTCKNCAASKCS